MLQKFEPLKYNYKVLSSSFLPIIFITFFEGTFSPIIWKLKINISYIYIYIYFMYERDMNVIKYITLS